jgi:hypothetical protein
LIGHKPPVAQETLGAADADAEKSRISGG